MSLTADAPATLARQIDAALPQTQCTRCGYPNCAGYAEAVASGEADINQCPPGGEEGVRRLAVLTGRPARALDPQHGVEGPRTVAWIDEHWCIGCTLCLKACPTDAIAGANKRMHTVLEDWCTGCELCIPACPVDCIHLDNASGERTGWDAWSATDASWARERYGFHTARQQQEEQENAQRLDNQARAKLADIAAHSKITEPDVLDRKRSLLEAALARAKSRS